MANLLFNNFTSKPQGSTSLLSLIINHPLFEQKVIEFRHLFSQLELKPQNLIKLGTLYYTFILPEFPSAQHKRMATQLFESLQLDDSNVKTLLTYTHLGEYLGKICQLTLQNIDLRNSVGFLSLLMDRITDYSVINFHTNQKKKVHYHFKLQLFDGQAVINDTEMPEKFHRLMSKDVYFQEKVYYDEERLQINQYQILVRQLKSQPTEVVPHGYVCQDFISEIINSDFETKNSYRLKRNRKVGVDKLEYWISPSESVNNYIRDQVVNQQIFYTTGILSASHLPVNPIQSSKVTYQIARINHIYSHQNYYQKLKETKDDKIKYFNILSQFFQRDEFNIDEITLTREKLIARRKQHLLGIQSKETIRKDSQKNFEDQARMLPQKIYQSMMMFLDQKKTQLNFKELNQVLKHKLEEGKNINTVIQNYLSENHFLPKDSADPFMDDIINFSKKQPLQLLVIGRPKCGKSTLSKAVAKKYNLVYISVQSMVNGIFQRVKFFQQNPPEADQDGNIIGGLAAIQKCIIQDLNEGKPVDQEDLLDLINNQLQKYITQSKGFILDLPFEYKKYWIDCVISNKIKLPKINCRFFTHIIQIQQSDEQWKYFLEGIMQKPQDLTVTSAFDRYMLAKPKPVPQQGEEQQAAEENEEEKPQPLKQDNLIFVRWKQGFFSLIQHLTQHIHPRRYLKLQNAFKSVEQCLQSLQDNFYVIPLAKRIQGADKQLLTVGHDETKLVRKWSPWGIIDPVYLKKDKLINGKYQFAAEYAGRVFVFQNENNLNNFINSPRKYLDSLPRLPNKTNICIAGPRKPGKKTLAKMLSQIYGLPIINFEQILQRVILKQKSSQMHIPSNPQVRSKTVHLSQPQFKQLSKGNLLNGKDILPIILYQLGIQLQKKPAGWGSQGQQGLQSKQQQQKKALQSKKKKKQKPAQQQRPKTPPIQDLPLRQIIPRINHQGKLPQTRGYILVNFPNNEEQLQALRQFNLPIDKLVLLSDNSQETPNRVLRERLDDAELEQVAAFFTAIQPVREALGEDVCREVSVGSTREEVLNKVRQFVDPFYLKIDDDAVNRVLADKTQEGDPVAAGFSGDYCPVALKEKWLIKGKQQFQAGVQGKRFKFCAEKEFNQFKQNPQLYLDRQNTIVPPRIMFMGLRGVGLTTQLSKFNQKYKIPILNLKQTLLQQIQAQKTKRKSQRYYKRGFKKPQFDEQGKMIEDQELNAQSAQFDKRTNQIEITRRIFQGIDQILINGNFFQVDQDKISTNIVELLTQAKRLPQVVYVLKCDESKWLQRNLNKFEIQRQLDAQIQKIRQQRRQKQQQARKAAQQSGQEPPVPLDEQQQLPKIQQRLSAKEQSLKAQRQSDLASLQASMQAFRGLNIEVIEVNCQRQATHVRDKINHSIRPYLGNRASRWEKIDMLALERHRAREFIGSFIVTESRFGRLNPIRLVEEVNNEPLIYRDRVYYLSDQEERQAVIMNPHLLETNRAVPNDVNPMRGIFVIGKTKTGKTTLSRTLAQKLGMIYISFVEIVTSFLHQHQDVEVSSILAELKQGKTLSDDQTVKLISKRLSLADCQKKGWILDGLPQNKNQAELLNRKGIIPISVFSLTLSDLDAKKRAQKANSNCYETDMQVVHQRIFKNRKNLSQVQLYYETKYNNLKILDASLSKWGLLETSRKIIEKKAKARRQFARSLALFEASEVSEVGLNFNCVLNNMSDYQNYCPISFKIKRQYIRRCLKVHENIALYNRKLYVFNSSKQLKDFLENPQTYVSKGPSFSPPNQVELQDFKRISEKSQNKGYCMVELLRKRLLKGNFTNGLIYKNKLYLTSTAKSMKLFIRNPTLYQMVKLPDKLPVEFQKKNQLKKIAKRNDCTAFLQHHLSNIMMKSLAQLGYRRPKYPSLSSKQSALKFLAISLKSTNPNKDDEYRQKYAEQLHQFIKQCSLSEQIRSEVQRKNKSPQEWKQADQENLIILCEEYSAFMKHLESQDKPKYFSKFIR